MKKSILAIGDTQRDYACHLMDYLSRKELFPFEVQIFTKKEMLKEFTDNTPVPILLIAQNFYETGMEKWTSGAFILLQEEETAPEGLTCIPKYQPAEKIIHFLMEYALPDLGGIPVWPDGSKTQFLGIYTPVGRCLQTSFSFVLGQLLARKYRTLYLNFECFSGLSQMLGKDFLSDFSDLFHYLSGTKEQFLYRLETMTEQVNGLCVLPPFYSGRDMSLIEREEWMELFEKLRGSSYDFIILDLSAHVQGLFDILRQCSRIYTITREDGFALAKMEQYENALEQMEYQDVLKRTRKCSLPIFKRLPPGLYQMTVGELAEYTEALVREDF